MQYSNLVRKLKNGHSKLSENFDMHTTQLAVAAIKKKLFLKQCFSTEIILAPPQPHPPLGTSGSNWRQFLLSGGGGI